MKAIIPVAGTGVNLRPHTYTQPKALMPLAGKTILGFIIEQLSSAGITDFVFIIGYMGDKIKNYVITAYPNIQSTFVVQSDRNGIGDAVLLTKEIVGSEEMFIILGDTVSEFDVQSIANTEGNLLGIMKVDDPRRFGIVEQNQEDEIMHLVEKPSIPKSNKALVGIYKIKDSLALFNSLEKFKVESSKTKEPFSLTEALENMLQSDIKFTPFRVKYWYDCGRKESVLKTNSTLLSKSNGNIDSSVKMANTIIIQPVSIGVNVKLENSIIGPNVSVGSNATIKESIVKECIIGAYTSLHEVVLHDSIIGNDAEVKGLSRSLNIGDNTEIDFG